MMEDSPMYGRQTPWPDIAHYTHQEDNTDITLNMEMKWISSN